MVRLTGVNGAQYQPFYSWNSFQTWEAYDPAVIERDLGFAATLGLNSIRTHLDYEYWYIEATDDPGGPNAHLESIRHFITACENRGIEPIFELFESAPEVPPTVDYRRAPHWQGTTYNDAGGTRSPPWNPIGLHPYSIGLRNWTGDFSPMHFCRRLANEFGHRNDVVWEIMNEPGEIQPRQDFVVDMVQAFRQEAPDAAITLGCKAPHFNELYENRTGGELDIHQFHMNLPGTPQVAVNQLQAANDHADEWGKPIWCTEVQRTMEEPPSRFMPNYKSIMDTIHDATDRGWIDGWHVWGLMMQPAYLRDVRELGRYNGIFFPGGEVFDLHDARAIARNPDLDLEERRIIPLVWSDHPFPYPAPIGASEPQCDGDDGCAGPQTCENGTCVDPEQRARERSARQTRQAVGAGGLLIGAFGLYRRFL